LIPRRRNGGIQAYRPEEKSVAKDRNSRIKVVEGLVTSQDKNRVNTLKAWTITSPPVDETAQVRNCG